MDANTPGEVQETTDIENLLGEIFWAEEQPTSALQECIRRQEEAIPHLMRAMEFELEDSLITGLSDGEEIPYSMLLLAQIRHRPAYPLFLKLVRHPAVEDILGDMVTESLGRCLAACWDGNLHTLIALTRDTESNEFVRAQGTTAIVCLAAAGEIPRIQAIQAVNELLREFVDQADNVMPVYCLDAIVRLYPDPEAESLIREAYAKDLIAAFDFPIGDFEEILQQGFESVWQRTTQDRHCSLQIDAVQDSSWWAAWHDSPPSDAPFWIEPAGMSLPDDWNPDDAWNQYMGHSEPVEQLKSDKVGRNDPCPCNSGKKFKKCCGA